AEALIASGAIERGMVPKVKNLIEAARGGVPRVHILSGHAEHGLLAELFTREGAGTMITLEEERERWLSE
ncbi:MAG: acetylglutamate kinase, partial [Planctomycetes bacterium]|nr:acetylglutamate kinase [Planctomycetota bacterium]